MKVRDLFLQKPSKKLFLPCADNEFYSPSSSVFHQSRKNQNKNLCYYTFVEMSMKTLSNKQQAFMNYEL